MFILTIEIHEITRFYVFYSKNKEKSLKNYIERTMRMVEVSKNNYLKVAYQIDKETLLKLEDVLFELIESDEKVVFKYNVILKDDTFLKDLTLKNVLNLPNIKESIIKSISLTTPAFLNIYVSITFSNFLDSSINYMISVDDEKFLRHYEDKITNFLETLNASYAPLAKFAILRILIFLIPVMYVIAVILYSFFPWLSDLEIELSSIILISGISGFCGAFIDRIFSNFFPIGEFLIGNGINHSKKLSFIRTGILLTIVLGLASSFLAKLIF